MYLGHSSNRIPNVHRFITSEHGENYWFNGCIRYVMEALGEFKQEPSLGYWFFAGLTGDILTQVFSHDDYMGECVSACRYRYEGGKYLESIFEQLGYESSYIPQIQLQANREFYILMLMEYIDKGLPVICIADHWPPWCVYVGYEEHGQKLLMLTDNLIDPECISADAAFADHPDLGWVFVGAKKHEIELKNVYRETMAAIPGLFSIKNEKYCFGAEAFYAWADRIENGYFDQLQPEIFRKWEMYTSNICNMATNGCCAVWFLNRVKELNPQLQFVDEIIQQYERIARIWERDDGKDLEAIGAGFNITLESLKDRTKRKVIANRLREAGNCLDRIDRIIRLHMEE